ncbi:flagellar hook-associated protein FlgL [Ramlibacter sp. AW1]|uniref:Flagellar hook-associated protein FlgL n=1 Tax=Ramlibacter aurantiacus TaxID=2801330 RepID=A0A937D430_9BURK|nr:flagellar hook-associated protein FlgL [Ramlibacter aurantiacus]MBL0423334.1 flagellar hook-associated protein FlgL [Ramlibacter aurantiacus]
MRVPTLYTAQRAFEAIEQRLGRQAQLQEQLGSGLRVTRPGDDPLAAAQAELARSRLARLSQDQRANDLATSLLSTAEGALGQGVSLLQSARELLVSAGNAAYGPAERQALAVQLRSLREQLLEVANASDGVGGRVFGGLAGAAPVATGDTPEWLSPAVAQRIGEDGRYLAAVDGRSTFMAVPQGNGHFVTASDPANTGSGWIDVGSLGQAGLLTAQNYRIEIGGTAGGLTYAVRNLDTGSLGPAQPLPADGRLDIDGQRVAVAGTPAPGDAFSLGPAGRASVFQVLQDAAQLLESPATSGAFQERLQRVQATLDRGLEGLSLLRSQVGGELQRLESARSQGQLEELSQATRRSQLQDVDVAKAISELRTNELGVEAALRSYASIGRVSLFEYLG